MKKVIFTACLIVSFSGVSNANTSNDKKVKLVTDCGAFASHMMAAYEEMNDCLSSEDYNAGYHYFKGICEI